MSQRCAGCGSVEDLAHYGWTGYEPGDAGSFNLCLRCRTAVGLPARSEATREAVAVAQAEVDRQSERLLRSTDRDMNLDASGCVRTARRLLRQIRALVQHFPIGPGAATTEAVVPAAPGASCGPVPEPRP